MLACIERTVAKEAGDYRGFDGDDLARVVTFGDPFIWHAIQYVHRGGSTIGEAGEFRSVGLGVVERWLKALAEILLTDTARVFEFGVLSTKFLVGKRLFHRSDPHAGKVDRYGDVICMGSHVTVEALASQDPAGSALTVSEDIGHERWDPETSTPALFFLISFSNISICRLFQLKAELTTW